MRYVLITAENKTRVYHLQACAEMYQKIYGGHIVEIFVGEMA